MKLPRLAACALFALLPLAARASSVTVQTPWVRFLLPSLPAAGYMVLNNSGNTPAELTAAASPNCGMLMLHQSQDSSGIAGMVAVPSITIPAHGRLVLAPGGYHLMCMQPRMQVGTTIVLHLSFNGGTALNVNAPVYGAQTGP